MFISFYYLLRSSGLKVSLNEWLTVLEGLEKGLHGSTLSGFYTLCRAVVVNSESDFDRFDEVFLEFFKGIKPTENLPEELLDWLEHPDLPEDELRRLAEITGMSMDEIEKLFAQRLLEQTEEHNGGNKWIGTDGYTAFGNHGKNAGGIRVGGKSRHRSAYRVAGERKYRDWRSDNTMDSRQFQIAFRSLRQLSSDSSQPRTELDIDATIRKTCDNAGTLKVEYRRPRCNNMKMMMLIDSGGSMDYYRALSSLLFQSVSKAGHFKDLRIYYFHNCLENKLYLEPTLDWRHTVSTDWVLDNIPPDYRVIIVGDGEMAVDELLYGSDWYRGSASKVSGLDRFLKLKNRYSHLIWFHPQPAPQESSYWTRTFEILQKEFDMYPLSLSGLTQGMKKLMVNH